MLTAWGIGLGITVGIKMVITMACRKIQYRAFYRIRPAAANVSALGRLSSVFLGCIVRDGVSLLTKLQ